MSSTARRVSWLGLFLIAFGALLLLRRFDVIDLRLREILWPLLILLGIVVTARGFADGRKGKIIFGSLLFLYSIFFFIRALDRVYVPIDMFVPASFLILGIVAFMVFINNPRDWYYLIPAFFLLGLGILLVMSEYGYLYYWEAYEVIGDWWPVVLVVFGAGMLLRHRQTQAGRQVNSADRPAAPETAEPERTSGWENAAGDGNSEGPEEPSRAD